MSLFFCLLMYYHCGHVYETSTRKIGNVILRPFSCVLNNVIIFPNYMLYYVIPPFTFELIFYTENVF